MASEKRFNHNHHPLMKAILAVAVIVIVVPLIVLVVWSFVSIWSYPNLIPDAWTTRAYEYLLDPTSKFGPAVVSSLVLCAIVCFLGVVISTMAGHAIAFYDFKGKQVLDFLVYLPQLVPSVVFGIGAHVLFIRMGLSGTFIGVVLVQLIAACPFSIKMMTNASRMLGDALIEQAIVLGSSRISAFFQVAFKPLLPTMIAAACMISTVSLGDYFLTFLIGSGKVSTFATLLVPMVSSADTNVVAAYTTFYLIMSFSVFLVMEGIGNKILKKQQNYLV